MTTSLPLPMLPTLDDTYPARVRERAAELYSRDRLSCAESALQALLECAAVPCPLEVVRLASGFGRGMGEAGCACGALVGAVMAVGALFGRVAPTGRSPQPCADIARAVHDGFTEVNRATCCRVLHKGKPFGSAEQRAECASRTEGAAELAARIILRHVSAACGEQPGVRPPRKACAGGANVLCGAENNSPQQARRPGGNVTDLLETPLGAWHRAQGAKMAPFAGWDMPIQYAGILAEHEHTRAAASVFDICHMGEFLLHGAGAAAALARAVTHNLDTLKPGKCRYGFLLNAGGGVLDDLIVYRFAEDSFMLVVNGAWVAGDFAALRERMPAGVTLEDVSNQTAKIDLQGPQALEVLEAFSGSGWRDLGYFSFREARFAGERLLVSRTGYTGELGYELYAPWGKALPLWEALLADGRVKPAGLGARDTLRLEAGLPLYGHELDTAHTPSEAGMGKMLTSTADYVGRAGAGRVVQRLLPLRIEGRRSARNGDALALPGGDVVGVVTSGSFAPSLGHAIAFAWVDKAHAAATAFEVRTARAALPATVATLPFYTQGTARITL